MIFPYDFGGNGNDGQSLGQYTGDRLYRFVDRNHRVGVAAEKGKSAGMGAISGGSGNYFDTNANPYKMSAILSKITVFVAVLIIVLTIVLNIVG